MTRRVQKPINRFEDSLSGATQTVRSQSNQGRSSDKGQVRRHKQELIDEIHKIMGRYIIEPIIEEVEAEIKFKGGFRSNSDRRRH